ncbi:MAG: Do family serine endopeptidase [Planctomycetales bacterium]|nr:Do family serine endopeptidase [Planctomycetales bacterium]
MRPSLIYQKTRFHFHALLAIAALAVGGLTAATVAVSHDGHPGGQLPPPPTDLQETSHAFRAVAKQAAPAVVHIKVQKQRASQPQQLPFENLPKGFDEDLWKRFFGDSWSPGKKPSFKMPPAPPFALGQGSGFLISQDGYILTNAHVVDGASQLTVRLADGREMDARTIGTDQQSDVAVVKVEASGLPVLAMGDSDQLAVGQWVLAVGSPFGLPGTVTAGIVSAQGRSGVGIADYENFIQTDAAINPGNSGGPLLNLKGEAIGINTAIFSRTGAFNGIGFAIPINMARDICDQLIKNGSVTRGWLGISIQELTAELADSFGVPADVTGVLIGDVLPDSPAAKAGLKAGDVIVDMDKQPVRKPGAFRNRVASLAPGSTVRIAVMRDGTRREFEVTLGTLPGQEALAQSRQPAATSLGLTVAACEGELAGKYGHAERSGVIVTDIASGSPAQLAGIQPGWLITDVNGQAVPNLDEFQAAMKEAKTKETVRLRIKQGEYASFVILKFPA